MGHTSKRKSARRKQPSCTSRLGCKVPTKASPETSARWSNLPEGPLLRMFEVMAGQDDGRSRVRKAQLVCRAWRSSALEVVLGDTATSRPYRPPMQAGSEQAKPAATMNTCGAMMVGSNQSKEVSNDGVEVCSKPPKLPTAAAAQPAAQAGPSSSGNMVSAPPCPQAEEEQAGSVEQQAPAVAKRGRQRREDVTPSWQLARCDTTQQHFLGAQPQATRRVTRAQAAAAAAAEQAQADQSHEAAPAAASVSERGNQPQTSQPSGNAAEDRSGDGPAMQQSEEVQGGSRGGSPASAHMTVHGDSPASAHTEDTACQQTPASEGQQQLGDMLQHHSDQPHVPDANSAAVALHPPPGWRRLEARVEGVFSTWSIFKRFGRRMHPDS